MKRQAFTLIELLVVIVIAGIMLSIGVVAFTKMAQGTKLQTAATDVYNTLNLARQYAITHRVMTMVVFSINPAATGIAIAPPYTSYAVATNATGSSGEATSATPDPGWGYITNWKRLPDGIVFDFTKMNSTWPLTGSWSEADPSATGSSYTARGIRTHWMDFPVAGTIQRAGFIHFSPAYYQFYNVFLREGYYDSSTGLPVYTPAGTVTNVNYVEVVVAWPTGTIFTRKK